MLTKTPLIEARNLHKSFGTLEVLKGVNLCVQQGEILAIVGKSGAGKTTLLQILGTLDRPTDGQVFINGQDVFRLSEKALAQFRNRHIGFIFQFHQLLPEFTALENVMMPALIAGESRKQSTQRAEQLLTDLGLSERLHHKPNALSGGEKQRVAAARALMMSPSVILADEPTGSLDEANKQELNRLLLHLLYREATAQPQRDRDLRGGAVHGGNVGEVDHRCLVAEVLQGDVL